MVRAGPKCRGSLDQRLESHQVAGLTLAEREGARLGERKWIIRYAIALEWYIYAGIGAQVGDS